MNFKISLILGVHSLEPAISSLAQGLSGQSLFRLGRHGLIAELLFLKTNQFILKENE